MSGNQVITLERDCDGVLIPAGTAITLKAGSTVQLTQALGGSYTLYVNGNLVRIEGKDADAIGIDPDEDTAVSQGRSVNGSVDEAQIWEMMKTCYDPEIPVNIVDLGLIYDCRLTPTEDGGTRVDIKMTLTAPGCGMGDFLARDVESKIRAVAGVAEVHVDVVWEPVWNQNMMSEAARLQLGMF